MKQHTDEAWQFITDELFCPETGLLYDYLGSFDHAERFRHLPVPEEIAASFPNPCGWGTGMEDCALNGGFLMDILRLRGELESDFAAAALRGLLSLGTVHGKRGFIVRGISPADGKSCYGNSSRDQFTLAVFGLLTFWRNRRCDARLRQETAELLSAVADHCEETVTPENNYSLRRLDGGRAIVSKLWECAPHEAFRLPMIFAAAYEATGEQKYLALVGRYAEPALRQTLAVDPAGSWWDMPLVQMQISLRSFRDSRIAPRLDGGLDEAMRIGARIARSKLAGLTEEAAIFKGRWDVPCGNWRQLPMRLTRETLAPGGALALFDGKSYLNPCFEPAFYRPAELLRGIGNYLASIALAGEAPPEQTGIGFPRCASVAAVPFLYGTMLTRMSKQTQLEEAAR